ncbi:TlpA disulfide reductase family protein [Palleronia sp. LCG004]|uniref:TlpA disulfide reductase family protein n=1 Tax=Palleronia sp. LCG004 TaxID=3079304 RepID=UPI0029438769|nr:TlpA disulfide reductase family protein [Palleronia sp. LCG004]WOI57958.1 TlpA disulfide reductase family protein [Palleronia sp. LCG004]
MSAVQIGPLLFDGDRFAAIMAALAFAIVAGLVARWRGADVPVFGLLIAWVVFARIGFVVENWETFSQHPFEIFAVWQGGFSVRTGTIGLLGTALVFAIRRSGMVAPVISGTLAAAFAGAITPFLIASDGGSGLPDTPFLAYEGPPVVLSERAGRPLAINLWATWCPPCRREMPMMMDVASRAEGVDVVFANQAETPPRIAGFLDDVDLPGEGILLDPEGDLLGGLGAMGLPTTLFYDADGRLVAAHTGEISRAEFTSRLEDLGGEIQ